MKHFNLHTIINSALLIGIIATGTFYLSDNKKSMAFVDNVKLFNEFNMTKDIKQVEERKIKTKAKQLDSIYKRLQLEKDQKSNQAQKFIKEITQGREQLEALQNNYKNNLSQDVWSRLNTYISDYSKSENIDIVFGVTGNGNVMYAEETIDITDQILEFSNTKYEGN